jgi:hypothetical protein
LFRDRARTSGTTLTFDAIRVEASCIDPDGVSIFVQNQGMPMWCSLNHKEANPRQLNLSRVEPYTCLGKRYLVIFVQSILEGSKEDTLKFSDELHLTLRK